ncbi:MAG: helix-turn-helix domain-containing protein [Acidobacteriota bacterium]|nr:helix-turn-helix domain-containing protein [Acidobacteriota bacterium]
MKQTSYCPVESTLEVIGGKWKTVILYHLREGKKRFGELKRVMPLTTQKVLTQQLRELEADGLVSRRVFPEIPPRVEYDLTELGRSLEPVLAAMCAWGVEYDRNKKCEAG